MSIITICGSITRHGAAFGDAINQVLVFPTEFEEIQREYPIFFRKDGEGAFSRSPCSASTATRICSSTATGWQARYVPAMQRRGPFSIALQERPARRASR